MISPPVIDSRTGEQIVEQGKALGTEYTPDWIPREGDRGLAMLSLFGRLMEIVISRLNCAPEKSFLAFLDTAGISLLPSKAARAPVRFVAVEGAPDDGVALAGTQIATAPPSGQEPVTFETEKSLVVHRSRLLNLFTLDPADDTFDDRGDVLSVNEKNETAAFQPFCGTTLIPHRLYIAQDTLFRINYPTRITLKFTLGNWDDAYEPFFKNKVIWKTRFAGVEKDITPPASAVEANATNKKITITFDRSLVTNIEQHPVAGEVQAHSWIWAETREQLLPVETTMQIAPIDVKTDANDIVPESAFFNTLPLDLMREIYPFGDRPKLYDTFFFAALEAFSKEGSRITGEVDFHPGASPDGIALQWEFWNGSQWETLGATNGQGITTRQAPHGFLDYTNAFTGTVLIDRNGKPTVSVVSFVDVALDIVDATSDPANKFKLVVTQVAGAAESFDELTMDIVEARINGSSRFIKVMNLNSPSSAPDNRPRVTTPHLSIPRSRVEFDCPKIELKTVNGKESSWLRVRIIGGNYGADAKMTPKIANPTSLANWDYKPPTYKPPIVASMRLSYEYETGQQPTALRTENSFALSSPAAGSTFFPFVKTGATENALYLGFDRTFTPSPAVLFLAVQESTFTTMPTVAWEYWNGGEWKRLGIQDGTANFTESGTVEFIGPSDASAIELFGTPSPRYWIRAWLKNGEKQAITLLGVYLNTTWAKNCTTVRNELLGSSNETPNAEFTLSRFPVLEGLKIEVREPDRPSEEELAILRDEEGGDVLQPAEGQASSREYWVRWHRVDHFRFSGKKSRHVMIDWSSGKIRFGNGVNGMIPPAGRENIRAAWYQSGGGVKGTAARNAITVLKRSIPFVEKAFNVGQAGGGSDAESAESVMVRGPQTIKNRSRAVTLEDYEWLAREASFQVARARCLPAKNKDDAGTVRLIIVPLSDEPQPMPSQGLIRQVQDHLNTRERRIGTASLSVIGPKYVGVSVRATVFPEKLEETDLVSRRVRENLTAFFHPLSGGPDGTGWEFGRDVYVSEVCKVIEDTEGVHHAEDVSLSSAGLGLSGVDHIPVSDDTLVASGDHSATISTAAETSSSAGTTLTAAAAKAVMFLGNLHSRELHDLRRTRPQCHIERIRPEYQVFFRTVEEAQRQGYDFCGWCFGPGLSIR